MQPELADALSVECAASAVLSLQSKRLGVRRLTSEYFARVIPTNRAASVPHSVLNNSELCAACLSGRPKRVLRNSYPGRLDVSLALPIKQAELRRSCPGSPTCPRAARAAGPPKPHSTPPKLSNKTATYSSRADPQLPIGGIHDRLHPRHSFRLLRRPLGYIPVRSQQLAEQHVLHDRFLAEYFLIKQSQ